MRIIRSRLSCLLCASRIWNVDIISMKSTLKWISRAFAVKSVWSERCYLFSQNDSMQMTGGIQFIDNRGLLAGCPNATFWLVDLNWLANTGSQHSLRPACISNRDRQFCIKQTLVVYCAWVNFSTSVIRELYITCVSDICSRRFHFKRISTSSYHSNLRIKK